MYALTSIKGIGRRFSNLICKKAEVDVRKRAGELQPDEIERLVGIINNPLQFRIPQWFFNRQKDHATGKYSQLVGSQLDHHLHNDIDRLKKMRAHRGLRHYGVLKFVVNTPRLLVAEVEPLVVQALSNKSAIYSFVN